MTAAARRGAVAHARAVLGARRADCNHARPRGGLGGLMTPAEAAELARGPNGGHDHGPRLQP